ncbi:MAG: AEC family transporter [Candidatus Brocadiaceae bacterium]|nr:AEC family transporter [Candidatus Brocadiaceae bacterium]
MLEVLTICLPVFAMIGLGALLRRVGFIDDTSHAFLSRFVYLFALPAIIFLHVASSGFRELFVPGVVVTSVLAIAGVLAVFRPFTSRLAAGLRGPVLLSTFFANTAYLGIPLARSAYGSEGLRYAAIVNAFMFPLMVVLSVSLLAGGQAGARWRWRALRAALLNPSIIAALVGVLVSGAVQQFALADLVGRSVLLSAAVDIGVRTLRMLESMSLPLALIAVGASLRLRYVHGHMFLMAACSAGKLLLMPLVALLGCRLLFPGMPGAAVGTTVLLMGSPLAVTSYVLGREMNADGDLIAGLLVVSTITAVLTIPMWLLILP